MSTIIQVEGLGKKYILSHQRKQPYYALRDVMTETVKNAGQKVLSRFKSTSQRSAPAATREEFWALKDVSFEIKQGDRVGIIGRNGAGKSTLLKVLSRIVEPSKGRVGIRGRVASLLEVGTGFHPELTGRENIYLNGAILGMTKAEIKRKFDEIVDFAEVEKFLDTPVKRYSSGMYVRLAFAVSAHLEPEILMVDEVLAVGDVLFQKKCLGKMEDVGKEGRTVLFVSHNMQAIRQLCDRCILLRAGEILADEKAPKAIELYLADNSQKAETLDAIIRRLPPDPTLRFDGIAVTQENRPVTDIVENGLPLEITIRYRVFERARGLRVFFDLFDDQETLLFRSFHDEDGDNIPLVQPGSYISRIVIPADLLAPITYTLKIYGTIFNVRMIYPDGISIRFSVQRTGKANRAYLIDPIRGKLAPVLQWDTKNLAEESLR